MRRVWLPWPRPRGALRWCREVAILDMGASLVSMRAGALPSLHQEGSFFARLLKKGRSRTKSLFQKPVECRLSLRERASFRGAKGDNVALPRLNIMRGVLMLFVGGVFSFSLSAGDAGKKRRR